MSGTDSSSSEDDLCFGCFIDNIKCGDYRPLYREGKRPEDLPDRGLDARVNYIRLRPFKSIYPDDEYIIYPSGSDFEDSDFEGLNTPEVRTYGIPYSTVLTRREARHAERERREQQKNAEKPEKKPKSSLDDNKPIIEYPKKYLERTMEYLTPEDEIDDVLEDDEELRAAHTNPPQLLTFRTENDEIISEDPAVKTGKLRRRPRTKVKAYSFKAKFIEVRPPKYTMKSYTSQFN